VLFDGCDDDVPHNFSLRTGKYVRTDRFNGFKVLPLNLYCDRQTNSTVL
jgi:hypothetical protein